MVATPLAEYKVPGIHSAVGATAIAGGIGSIVVFSLALLLGWLLIPKSASKRT